MSDFDSIKEKFSTYNPLIFDLVDIPQTDILGLKDSVNFDVKFSNSICFPEINLGFHHFIHKTKDKMEIVDGFSSRKKVYQVTSLFEKSIDYKEQTDSGIPFDSIDKGITQFIKSTKPDFPPLLNRAFLKMWEILVEFDLIEPVESFISSHLAEGPGSFIQATILYRELQSKLNKVKTLNKDGYYGVTLHSDHSHLLMQQNFIKYFDKETPKRLHIMETKSVKEIRDLYGGFKGKNTDKSSKIITNGDLTKLNTIIQFAGSKTIESFTKPSDLVTADGGFDWKRENLQEQEAYRLIFSEIVTALKIQKNGGNFVIKIFETFTKVTIKFIQLLRQVYNQVYLAKPYTSRISNSEKYIVCKGFVKSSISSKIINKLEEQIELMDKNSEYQIFDIFTNIQLSPKVYESYKLINQEFTVKQYIGINSIVQFINLDNYNGIEFNEYLDKQIIASQFWNEMFLNPKNFEKIAKFFSKFNFNKFKETFKISEISEDSEQIKSSETNELDVSELKKSKIQSKLSRNKSKSTKSKRVQKGGNQIGEINEIEEIEKTEEYQNIYQDTNLSNSSDDLVGVLDNDIIDLNNIL